MMDTRYNQLKYMDDVSEEDKKFLIPFDIGEEVYIKDYRFEIAKVDVDANLLILKPIGLLQIQRDKQADLKRELDKLKAKGGLGS